MRAASVVAVHGKSSSNSRLRVGKQLYDAEFTRWQMMVDDLEEGPDAT
jgi:hypothetical protein